MESERYFALLDTLEREPVLVVADTTLGAVAEGEFRKLRKSVRALGDDPTDDALHATRIKGKRARYAAELLEGKAARDLVDAAKGFQDVIGDHQDAIVAEERLRRLARGSSARAALAVGRLVERQRQRRSQARAAVPAAWARLERASRRAFS
jgi:CHAD domain-containing protein